MFLLGPCHFITGVKTAIALLEQVWLNHSKYPSVDMATDFTKDQYAGVYKSFYDFASKYYGIDNLLAGSAVSPATFKSLNPIQVFDVSKRSEHLL